ncbi:hypothetical protein [Actinophytocola sp.]|uniref:hypothetical protein n=1 Tax=Actinophytocola sp. TaxID=1872138 RepID=UPI003D6AF1F7
MTRPVTPGATRRATRGAPLDVPRLGRGVPAWLLRLAVLLTGALVIAIPSTEGAMSGALFILCPAILASAYAPASPVPTAVVIGAAVLAALTGDDPLRPAVLALIPAVHLFHLSCAFAGLVPMRGRLHARAFVRPAIRFVAVQAVVFAFVGVAALLPVTEIPATLEIMALAGLVAVGLIIVWWHRHRGDDSHTGGGGR